MVFGSVWEDCPRCKNGRWTTQANRKSPCMDCKRQITAARGQSKPDRLREHPDLAELERELERWYA